MLRLSLPTVASVLALALAASSAVAQLPGISRSVQKQVRPPLSLRTAVSPPGAQAAGLPSGGLSQSAVRRLAGKTWTSQAAPLQKTNPPIASVPRQPLTVHSGSISAAKSLGTLGGKASARKLSPAGSLRIPSLDKAKLGPQPEPPDLPAAAGRLATIKSLSSAAIGSNPSVAQSPGKPSLAQGLIQSVQPAAKPSQIRQMSPLVQPLTVRSGESPADNGPPSVNTVAPLSQLGKPVWTKSQAETLRKMAGKEDLLTKPTGSENEPREKGSVDIDSEGNWLDFDGTFEEMMAYNSGGSYTWHTPAGGVWEVRVTPEGTEYWYTAPGAADAMLVHTREHEFELVDPDAGGGGAGAGEIPWWASLIPVPGVARYFDRASFVVPRAQYLIPSAPGPALSPGAVVEPSGVPGDTDQAPIRFTQRLLLVRNSTTESIIVSLQFRTHDEAGQWQWLPSGPGASQEALAFPLGPGQEGCLEHDGVPISASRVRIWVQSDSRTWDRYRDQDLWLVPEVDADGQHAYLAAEMETFPFVVE